MACGTCGGNRKTGYRVEYQVKFRDGTVSQFSTVGEAQAAIRKAGGGTMRAVQASPR